MAVNMAVTEAGTVVGTMWLRLYMLRFVQQTSRVGLSWRAVAVVVVLVTGRRCGVVVAGCRFGPLWLSFPLCYVHRNRWCAFVCSVGLYGVC